MTKDLTERRKYFIYLNNPTEGLYTTFGEYLYQTNSRRWIKHDPSFEIREGIEQEVPDTFVRLVGMPLAYTTE